MGFSPISTTATDRCYRSTQMVQQAKLIRGKKKLAKRKPGPILNHWHSHSSAENQNPETSLAAYFFRPQYVAAVQSGFNVKSIFWYRLFLRKLEEMNGGILLVGMRYKRLLSSQSPTVQVIPAVKNLLPEVSSVT
jgi:hypothetical protein